MENIKALVDLMTLRKVSDHVYEGGNYITPWRRVFGGQVLGQSLHAAYQTVAPDRYAHSMHGYFILAGDVDKPVTYEVDTIRDGGSFTTRRVVAKQDGVPIFNMAASFQMRQEGFDHQISMPNVLPPDVLLTDYEQVQHLKELHPKLYQRLTIIHPNAIEFRPVENLYKGDVKQRRPYRHVWFKSKEQCQLDRRSTTPQ